MGLRLPTGQMPWRRRHEGFVPLEVYQNAKSWKFIENLMNIAIFLAPGVLKNNINLIIALTMANTISKRRYIVEPVDPVNQANRNRGIESFTEEECWKHLRFKKADLPKLMELLRFPAVIKSHTTTTSGESAFCLMLWRLHYPTTWSLCQSIFGREYSQLSRIFNAAIDFVNANHKKKVVNNIDWYSDRFDLYRDRISRKIANLPGNPNPGTVPFNLSRIFGFIDGTANRIARPDGHNNLQNSFYNKYYRGHFLIWQGVSFPDGMIVIEGPEPGFKTDTMVWRDCRFRHRLERIMLNREAHGRQRLFLYAEKIYRTNQLIVAAFSRRQGHLQPWMVIENSIMSRIRVAAEWVFGIIFGKFKYLDFAKGQKLQEVSVPKFYIVATLLSNAHTCMYGGPNHTRYFNCEPPSVEDYFDQN